nr:hypothetical protein [Rhizobium leguminosarum]
MTKEAAALARNSAAPAISSGRPQRWTVMRWRTKGINSSFAASAAFVSVANQPGAIALLVMPSGPNSTAMPRISLVSPFFAAGGTRRAATILFSPSEVGAGRRLRG